MSFANTYATRAQRKTARGDGLDDYPTPPWATRALVAYGLYRDDMPWTPPPARGLTVLEPAANRGFMVGALSESFGAVVGSDIHDYRVGFPVADFLTARIAWRPDLVITNPPFARSTDFVRRGLAVARLGCAVLVRTTWTESLERDRLFAEHPPALVAQFVERVPMFRGRLSAKGSTATAYAWIVFLRGVSATAWRRIPPCRKALERAGDYPDEMGAVG